MALPPLNNPSALVPFLIVQLVSLKSIVPCENTEEPKLICALNGFSIYLNIRTYRNSNQIDR
jgi:hypothetical protein